MNHNQKQTQPTKILIVEDTDLHMKLFCDLLHAYDYETIQSHDGKDILEITRKCNPALIIMDIQLPTCSGLELVKLLKSDKGLKHIPIVAVTAFAMKGDKAEILEGGCDDYLAKPIMISAFLETIAKYLDK